MRFPFLVLLIGRFAAEAQTLSNNSLNGKYFVRHVFLTGNSSGTLSDARSLNGTLTFNGNGGFTFQGQQTVGNANPAATTGTGTYTVKPSGFVTLTNLLKADATVNARLGQDALVGASTEAGATSFDGFYPIPATTGM